MVKSDTISKVTGRPCNYVRKRTTTARRPQDLNNPQIQKKLSDMPQIYRGIYRRAMRGNDLRAAIHSFCLECFQWQREEISVCTSLSCPLYPYRPYQSKEANNG